MAQKKDSDTGVLGRLAGRGEDAMTRLIDELSRNTKVTEALSVAMSAKGRVDEATRRTLGQVGLAASDELDGLRSRLDRLEERLAKLEAGSGSRSRTGRKPTTSTKSSGGTAKPTSRSTSSAAGRSKSGGGSGSRPRSTGGSTGS